MAAILDIEAHQLNGEGLKHGSDHVCGMYESEEEHKAVVSQFLKDGLINGERVFYIVDDHTSECITNYLLCTGFDPYSYIMSGQLTIKVSRDVYGLNGYFDKTRMLNFWESLVQESTANGYKKVRASGEMTWSLSGLPGSDQLVEYESLLNHFCDKYPFVSILCQYNLKKFKSDIALAIITTHPLVMFGIDIFDNIYYMPPDHFLCNDLPTATLSIWKKNLQQLKQIDRKLSARAMEVVKANELARREMEERKKMESAKIFAESLCRAKSEFLAVVSHEIRTPLHGIMGGLQFLRESLAGIKLDKDQDDAFDMVEKSSNHLLTVINNVLDMSRFEFGTLELDYTSFDLRECIKNIVEMFSYTKCDKTLRVTWEIDDTIPSTVICDLSRLRQVITNLISNAQKFTPDNGQLYIRVSLQQHPKTQVPVLFFEFRDTGIGIPPEKCDKIFDAFSQGDTSISRRFDGLGLGLTICKKIIEAFGGNIWVHSELGKGSSFQFILPTPRLPPVQPESTSNPHSSTTIHSFTIQPNQHKFIAKPPTESHSTNNSASVMKSEVLSLAEKSFNDLPLEKKSMMILVAEDNVLSQKIVCKMLTNLGFSFHVAMNGLEAVQHVQSGNVYDVILMDLQMPVMGGIEAAKVIRSLSFPSGHKPKIVALTASNIESEGRSLFDLYLRKPFTFNSLQQAIDQLHG